MAGTIHRTSSSFPALLLRRYDTAPWVISAAVLGVGIAAPPGPARRARLVIGAAFAVVWFVVGRFVLGP